MKFSAWGEYILPVIETEAFKAFKSGMFKVTLIIAAFVPVMMGFLMYIKLHPDAAQNSLMFSKAQSIPGPGDWIGYMTMFAQVVSGVGLLLMGFASSWLWGREYSDRTVKDILALPFPRELIVVGKMMILFVWGNIMLLVSFLMMLLIGFLLKLPNWDTHFIVHSLNVFILATFLNIAISTVTACIASVTRSYLAPIGFAIATLVFGNFVGMLGLGAYYPWGIPMSVAMSAMEDMHIATISFVLFSLTSLFGLLATMYWWRYSDQQ